MKIAPPPASVRRGELTVIYSNAEVRADALETLAEGVRDPSIGYSQFEVERRPGELEVRMRYPAPRGEVIGRPTGEDAAVPLLCGAARPPGRAIDCPGEAP